MKKHDIINKWIAKGYTVVEDNGTMLTFKKKFSWFWCLVGGCIPYVIYHGVIKKKEFESYE